MSRPAARRVWAVIPAAGSSQRFNSSGISGKPKQYAPLHGATVLEWSLRALLAEPEIHAVVVVLADGDAHWPAIAAKLNHPKLQDGDRRSGPADSVLRGLEFLATQAAPNDWVVVHDAARPLFGGGGFAQPARRPERQRRHPDRLRMMPARAVWAPTARARSTPTRAAPVRTAPRPTLLRPIRPPETSRGAVLAAPIVDTVKRELGDHVVTVDRQGLWRSLTPQVFAFERLRHALKEAALAGIAVTDESQAVERMGLRPVLVRGSPFNHQGDPRRGFGPCGRGY